MLYIFERLNLELQALIAYRLLGVDNTGGEGLSAFLRFKILIPRSVSKQVSFALGDTAGMLKEVILANTLNSLNHVFDFQVVLVQLHLFVLLPEVLDELGVGVPDPRTQSVFSNLVKLIDVEVAVSGGGVSSLILSYTWISFRLLVHLYNYFLSDLPILLVESHLLEFLGLQS